MPSFVPRLHPIELNVDFYVLKGAKPDGNLIAVYLDCQVVDVIVDECGHRYAFVGVAPRKRDGRYDINVLRAGEVIVEPGLLYQLVPGKHHWFNWPWQDSYHRQ